MRLLQLFHFAVVIIQALRCFQLTVSLLLFQLRLQFFQLLLSCLMGPILVLLGLLVHGDLVLHLPDLIVGLIFLVLAD